MSTNKKAFAANMIGTAINCLLDKFEPEEIKGMMTTERMSKLIDYLSSEKEKTKQ